MTINQTQNFQQSPQSPQSPQSQQAQQSQQSQNSTRPWLRTIRVTLGPLEEWRGLSQGEVVRFESNGTPSGLRVECSLEKTIMGMPNPSQIKIYNLAQDTRNAIRGGLTKITVEAGWAASAGATSAGATSVGATSVGAATPELHIVFQGSISAVTSQRSGPDMITVISALPGYGALVRGVSSKSYGPGMAICEVVKDMARDLPGLLVSDSGIEGVVGKVGSGGWCFAGSTRDGLTQLANEFGFSWHVDNGHFKAIGDKAVFGGIFELCSCSERWNGGAGRSSGSSLSPNTQTYSKKTSDEPNSNNGPSSSSANNGPAGALLSVMPVVFGPLQDTPGVKIQAQYSPGLMVGATVRVKSDESPSLNGDYRALNSKVNLSTYSDEGWTMEVDGS